MSKYRVEEVYDGRLPEYQVIKDDIVVKTFDSLEEANQWCNEQCYITPCGEDDPCNSRED